ncbi:MAG: hypothetical protein C0599_18135 [Salinivirgaceae bacterium]|nr:MAG: hypothetical protein C0599_18135 [Salinivirgaceae bacterium]
MKALHLITVLSITLLFNTVQAQKCRYEIDEIDSKTEMPIKRTEPIELARVNNQPLLIKAQCIGPNKYLKIRYYRYNGFEIRDNEIFEFIFTDRSSIKLKPRELPKKKSSGGFVTVSSMLIFDLTKDQYAQLLNKPVGEIKYYVDRGGYVRDEIRKRFQTDLQYIMQCVLLDTDNL